MEIILTGNDLTLEQFVAIARNRAKVALSPEAASAIAAAHQKINAIVASGATVYGINTGFGKLSNVAVGRDELEKLQVNLLKSHACAVGAPLSVDAVRGAMLLRANALAKGYSGVRPVVVEQLLAYLNQDIIPVVPSKGSLGASGDLAPLAHLALTLLGEGEVLYKGKRMETMAALTAAGLTPLASLAPKEGLSLINGTQIMTAIGALALHDALMLTKAADIAGVLSLEALLGIRDAFSAEIHSVRPHAGQVATARNILRLTEGALISMRRKAASGRLFLLLHRPGPWASRDAFAYVQRVVETEFNSATDNPLVFAGEKVISGGNFHGQPLALAFDL